MKEVKIILNERRRTLVDDILKEYNIIPRVFISEVSEESSSKDRDIQWTFYLQNEYTNSLIERLKNVGVGSTYGAVSMMPLDFYISSSTDTTVAEKSLGVNLEEIIFSLNDASLSVMYVTLAILSGILAGYGISSNSNIILIGSMIVAPLLGPIALTSIGLLTPRRGILFNGLKTEAAGLLLTAGTGVVVGFSIMLINLWTQAPLLGTQANQLWLDACNNTQMFYRTQLNAPTIILAVFSGLAAGIIISKGMSVNIVGVAIAASICPPATNIGLNIAVMFVYMFNPSLLAGSAVINFYTPVILSTAYLILNIFLINISITVVLWIIGVASKSGITSRRRSSVIRTNIIFLTILLVIVVTLFTLFNPATVFTPTAHFCKST